MKFSKFYLLFVFINLSIPTCFPVYCQENLLFQEVIKKANSILDSKKSDSSSPVLAMIYIAGDNDLYPFAGRNIKQMQMVGTNENITILIDFHMHRPGQPKVSKRFIVEKNKLTQIGVDTCMDSGNMDTLISFWSWGIENWPKIKRRIAFIWNHATGVLEPYIKQAFNPSELFRYNPNTRLIELDRKIGFMDFINKNQSLHEYRGICFDDTTGNYLTIENLRTALKTTNDKFNNSNSQEPIFDMIIFDACLMSMIEIHSALKDLTRIVIGSQEVVLGTGLDYYATLSPFINSQINNTDLAKHIVSSYHKTYNKITNDFTFSAIDLQYVSSLENNIQKIALLFIKGLKNQKNKSVKETIKLSRHKNFCTHFDEPTYVDLGHFYRNILSNMSKFELKDTEETNDFRNELTEQINLGLEIFKKLIISNTVGKNLQNAHGVSIYFPDYRLHSSYTHSKFAINTGWLNFLNQYMSL